MMTGGIVKNTSAISGLKNQKIGKQSNKFVNVNFITRD